MDKPTLPPAETLYLVDHQAGQVLEFDGESWKPARGVYSAGKSSLIRSGLAIEPAGYLWDIPRCTEDLAPGEDCNRGIP